MVALIFFGNGDAATLVFGTGASEGIDEGSSFFSVSTESPRIAFIFALTLLLEGLDRKSVV